MNRIISNLAEEAESFYLYDEKKIKQQLRKLGDAFPGVDFLYSIKCNPNRGILQAVFSCGLGADAASLGEVRLATREGLGKDKIYYSAPGKTTRDIEEALSLSTIIADSLTEVEKIAAISGNEPVCIGLRINPDFSFAGSNGAASKFGVDEEDALRFLRQPLPGNIRVTGIHVHLKSQELDGKRLRQYYENMLRLAVRIETALQHPLDYINMGSGIGIPYAASDREIDLAELGRRAAPLFSAFRKTHPHTKLMIETGRYAVCQPGVYVTHVADRKVSYGKTYIILKNTLNGFMRPSLARLIGKYASLPAEPLYTGANAFDFRAPYPEQETETVTLAGDFCTATDIIAEDIQMPRLQIGDIVVINNAGAYAAALSPVQFSSLTAPKEYIQHEDGSTEIFEP